MIGAEIQINEKEAVTIGTYNFAYIFISCGRKTGNRMVAAGSNFKERYTWIDHPLQIGDKIKYASWKRSKRHNHLPLNKVTGKR